MTKERNKKEKVPMTKGKKIILAILIPVFSLILAVAITITSILLIGKAALTDKDISITPNENIETTVEDDNTVTYEGKKYRYKSSMTTVLCMGVDNTKKESGGAYVTGRAGQADAIYLIAIDTNTGKTSVIGIPRDSMADVEVYSKAGTYVGTEKTQICLSYAYGDGKDLSAQNTAKSVSRFLYGMPVNSYFAVDSKSIAPLHNVVGNITVTPNETIENYNIKFYKGQPFKLTGENVFNYLQARNDKTADASLLRLNRQTDYLKKYTAAVLSKTKSDITFPVKLYNKIVKNAVTDLDVSRVSYLATKIVGQKDNLSLDFVQIEGTQSVGEDSFAEFTPDETALFETVLNVFYEEIN